MATRRQKESRVRVQGYVPKSLRDSISTLGEMWSLQDKLDDPDAAAWTESEVVEFLLEVAEEIEWAKFGGEPADDEAKADLIARIKAEHKAQK